MKLGWCRMVQNGLEERKESKRLWVDNQHDPKRGHDPGRQVNQSGEHDHRPAQCPQDDDDRKAIVEVELPAETARHHQFQKDQPNPARQQKP